MRSLVVLMLAATMSAPSGDAAKVVPVTRVVEVAPNSVPAQFTVDCAAGQQVIAGGYSSRTQDLRVVSNYPAATGASWVVSVWNPTKLPIPIQLEASCLADDTRKVSVASAETLAVDCPLGTVAIGGGYRNPWTFNRSGFLVTGSYPANTNGWGLDREPIPGELGPVSSALQVVLLCMSGDVQALTRSFPLDLPAGPADCVSVPNFGATCTYARAGQAKAACVGDEITGGLGYRFTAGTVPQFAVFTASGGLVNVEGVTRDNTALTMQVMVMCLSRRPAESVPLGDAWPYLAGGGLLLLVAAVTVARSRSKRAKGVVGMDVTVTSQVGFFLLGRFKERP